MYEFFSLPIKDREYLFATYPSPEYQIIFLSQIHQDTFRKTDMERGLDSYSFLSDTFGCPQVLLLQSLC